MELSIEFPTFHRLFYWSFFKFLLGYWSSQTAGFCYTWV